MLGFKKKEKETPEVPSKGLFGRLRQGLQKTRESFTGGFQSIFTRHTAIDESLLEALETQCLLSDIGIEATESLLDALRTTIKNDRLTEPKAVIQALKMHMIDLLKPSEVPLTLPKQDTPFVLLMAGINGAGKTTTIGKLAKQLQADGKSVMLAAGDTFRAAAIEQLQAWGEKNAIPVIAQHTGADAASVIFDALSAAKARHVDVLIADTAGRLHTQSNLMSELEKITRVIKKLDPDAPHETCLVLDASIGQNALQQAIQFHEAIQLSGIIVTKLDGTAKGGILFAIAKKMGLPIRYIGTGEAITDLRPFNAEAFVSAILDEAIEEETN